VNALVRRFLRNESQCQMPHHARLSCRDPRELCTPAIPSHFFSNYRMTTKTRSGRNTRSLTPLQIKRASRRAESWRLRCSISSSDFTALLSIPCLFYRLSDGFCRIAAPHRVPKDGAVQTKPKEMPAFQALAKAGRKNPRFRRPGDHSSLRSLRPMALRPHLSMGLPLSRRESVTEY